MPIVTGPHMGNTHILLRAFFEELGVDYIIPPASSQRTLTLGVSNSPEMVCLPFKLTLGNFIEALDAGADTILFTEARGVCRLGSYFTVQKEILNKLGYEFNTITIKEHSLKALFSIIRTGLPSLSLWRMLKALRIGLVKIKITDELEMLSHKMRPIEKQRGITTAIYGKALRVVDGASTMGELKRARRDYTEKLLSIETKDTNPLKVGVVGEFFVVLDPFANLNIETELGKLGCEVHRTLWMSKWANFTLFLQLLGFSEARELHRAAMPYLKRDIGGDGWESVGEKVHSKGKVDGIVHVQPFGCLPEIVAQNIMTSINGVPGIYFSFDEQTNQTGMITRLEAFTDLLQRKKHGHY